MGQPNNSRAGGLALLPGVNAAQRTLCDMVLTLIRMTKDEKGLAFFKGLLL
jgi:hypothetical protein